MPTMFFPIHDIAVSSDKLKSRKRTQCNKGNCFYLFICKEGRKWEKRKRSTMNPIAARATSYRTNAKSKVQIRASERVRSFYCTCNLNFRCGRLGSYGTHPTRELNQSRSFVIRQKEQKKTIQQHTLLYMLLFSSC